MGSSRSSFILAALIALLGLLGGCKDETTAPPASGAIMVTVQTTGTDISLSGVRVVLNDGPFFALNQSQLPTVVTELDPGVYLVRLEGMAPNCEVVGQNPISVTVEGGITALAPFAITCVRNVGSLRITTVTTGGDQDTDGYSLMVDWLHRETIGANQAIEISDVRAGLHAIALGNVISNCAVAAPHPVNVVVAFHATIDVAFRLSCALAANLEVTVATTGVDIDANGYTVAIGATSLSYSDQRTVEPNAAFTLARIPAAADYRVTVNDVAANCEVAGPSTQSADLAAGGTARLRFDVACAPPMLLAVVSDGELYVVGSNGAGMVRLTTEPGGAGEPSWSSTGRIAFTTQRHSGDVELYAVDAAGTGPVRLTTSAGADDAPSWSPDGRMIVFRSTRDVNSEIYIVNADGSGLTRLTNTLSEDSQPAWSSTGKIAFVSDRDHFAGEIYVMDVDGSNVVRLTNNAVAEVSPAWSPDGSMIAFARAVDCYYYCFRELFVMNADGSEVRRLISSGAEWELGDPSWSLDGESIAFTQRHCPYYCSSPSVWIVDVHAGDPVLVTNNAGNPAWKP